MSADRRARPRRRRRADDREAVRRLTLRVGIAAAGLNAGLFLVLGLSELGMGGMDAAIVSAITGILPHGVQPLSSAPSPTPGGRPVVTTGGS